MISEDLETFKTTFSDYCETTFSYFDISEKEPEKFYHGFVLGLVACLKDRYYIRSNRESGYGRYDVMLIPDDKSKKGIVFEFKAVNKKKKETFEDAIEDAIEDAK